MAYLILLFIILSAVYGPQLWVRHVLHKHHRPLPNMPGTGGELAIHLLKQFKLQDTKVELLSKNEDHYSPSENAVCLSPEVYNGKSLTAVAVAAHEVGHAIQFNRKEKISLLHLRYLSKARMIQSIGIYTMSIMPLVGIILHTPHIMLLTLLVGVGTMFAAVVMHVAILPEEWDASFNKALPILDKGNYVPKEYLPAIRQVLTACALTYMAAALADILSIWRWSRLIR